MPFKLMLEHLSRYCFFNKHAAAWKQAEICEMLSFSDHSSPAELKQVIEGLHLGFGCSAAAARYQESNLPLRHVWRYVPRSNTPGDTCQHGTSHAYLPTFPLSRFRGTAVRNRVLLSLKCHMLRVQNFAAFLYLYAEATRRAAY